LKICKYVLINELHKNKSFYEKKLLGTNALLLPNYKKHFDGKKQYKGNGLSNYKFMSLFGPPYHALTNQ
jgi:hypothetical protein